MRRPPRNPDPSPRPRWLKASPARHPDLRVLKDHAPRLSPTLFGRRPQSSAMTATGARRRKRRSVERTGRRLAIFDWRFSIGGFGLADFRLGISDWGFPIAD